MKEVSLTKEERQRILHISISQVERKYRAKILKIDPDHFKIRRIRPSQGSNQSGSQVVPSQWPRARRQSLINKLKEQCKKEIEELQKQMKK